METRSLYAAWTALVLLSLSTAIITMSNWADTNPAAAGAGVLMLAGAKARVILVRYLNLQHTQFWRSLFDVALAGFLCLAFFLYLIGSPG